MRVLLLRLGSRSDIEPFVALGIALRAAGHEATLFASRHFAAFIPSHGLPHVPMDEGFIELLQSPSGRAGLARSGSLLCMLSTAVRLIRQVGPMQLQIQRACWAAAAACQSDLIGHHLKIMGASDIAQQLGVPAVLAPLVQGVEPTAARPCPLLPPRSDRFTGMVGRRAGYRLVNMLGTRFGAGPVQRWRQESGLPPRASTADLRHDAQGRPVLLLHAHNESLLPRPDDWPAHDVATGFWRLPPATHWQRPLAFFQAFLDTGPPPIYVGFGSMVGRDPAGPARRVVEALQLAGLRGVLARGWGRLQADAMPAHVHLIDEAPYDRLLPLMAALVHHGGSGTTAGGLSAGRVTVVCPPFLAISLSGAVWFIRLAWAPRLSRSKT